MQQNTQTDSRERAVIAGLSSPALPFDENSDDASLLELAALLDTAGGEASATVLQNRAAPDPGTFLGSGKIDELAALCRDSDYTLVLFDNALSPGQQRNIEAILNPKENPPPREIRVMDRAGLILDIFAQRAHTREGRLQVALAQYKYLLPRLTGMWTHLVRQTASGGSRIGTRGPGETQLETDRRHIRERITRLEREIEDLRTIRGTERRKRGKNRTPVAALVGYTNAGKSSLLNALTRAGIQANNRLFDTLDTTTRRLWLGKPDGSGTEALVSDTVGFIRKLPHQLVAAFRATLEELTYADVILHVIDCSNPEWRSQKQVCEALIEELHASDKPRINVYNKSDIADSDFALGLSRDDVVVSAKTGKGLDTLKEKIANNCQLSIINYQL
ncbi:MAG: GTPase HflX [Oscillospiraceae bacterium]|jgi:GTP-binding protein HflX|nr:GTPase HflX [Oscillospiraceae bacterium]